MSNTILIRYGELHLKGNNRGYFERRLIQNIRDSLSDIECSLTVGVGRYYVDNYQVHQERLIIDRLSCVYGIHNFSVAIQCDASVDSIVQSSLKIFDGGSFKVETNRSDKSYPLTSYQVSAQVGASILDKCATATVNLHNPNTTLFVDIRSNTQAFVYTNSHDGQGGLPYGTSGKGLLLLSGGIDSPVAGYKIAKRGMQLTALHFWSYPYTSEAAKQKVQKLVKLLSRYCPNMQLYIVNSTKLQEHIKKYCDDEYLITILRRCMLRIAKDIANRLKLDCIVTGESLGQVASQTIDSINISNHAINDLPILRPLISLDKSEIITIARQIDTYDTSILPYEDCCTVFMPRRPAIHPTRERALANESKIPDFDALIQQTIQETIDLVKLNAN